MKKNIPIFIVLALLCFLGAASSGEVITNVKPKSATVSVYQPFIVDVTIRASIKNPYDFQEAQLDMHITSLSGKEIVMPAFFTGKNKKWQVRYTPLEVGEYSYYLSLRTPQEEVQSAVYSFTVNNSSEDGFLRRSKNNSHYLVFDSGKSFFGLGHNVCWTGGNSASGFKRYFSKLKKSGCNITRIWLNNDWTLKLEYARLGKYNLSDAKEVDKILEEARKKGIYIILVFDSYSSLMAEKGGWGEQAWHKNVYNSKNKGPCDEPWDFFTNFEAKRLYKNRLRYIVSRWGYSPNILAFELWNEVDAPAEWVSEMSSYVKSINPHAQLVTTSLGYPWANNFDESTIWSLDEVDFVERHLYGNLASDIIGYVISTNKALGGKYKKPVLVEEFGMDWGKNDSECDPKGKGVAFHNGLWACLTSGSFAGTMGWWWDSYMCKHKLYHHYRSVKDFIEGVNWDSERVAFMDASAVMKDLPPGEDVTYSDVIIYGKEVWGDKSYEEFTVSNSGDMAGGVLNHYLHGSRKKAIRLEPVFHVDYPAQGKFIIYVGTVSDRANLIVTIDGEEVLAKEFLTGEGDGLWQNSFYRKDEKVYQCYYGTKEEINVPKGKHTIKISNAGSDWMGIKRIVLENYTPSSVVNARAVGLSVGDDILFWVQNKGYNWYDVINKEIVLSKIEGAYFNVMDIEDGMYDILWWDTFAGKAIKREKIQASGNIMKLFIPGFVEDIACRIKKSE